MFIEYPKSLYLSGNPESAHAIVKDKDEEAERRGDGYRMAWEAEEKAPAPVKRKPDRRHKVRE